MEGQKSRFPFTRFYGMTTCQISPGPHVDVLHFSAARAAELSRTIMQRSLPDMYFSFYLFTLYMYLYITLRSSVKSKTGKHILLKEKKKEKKERTVDKLTNELGPFCSLLQYLPVSFCLPF